MLLIFSSVIAKTTEHHGSFRNGTICLRWPLIWKKPRKRDGMLRDCAKGSSAQKEFYSLTIFLRRARTTNFTIPIGTKSYFSIFKLAKIKRNKTNLKQQLLCMNY